MKSLSMRLSQMCTIPDCSPPVAKRKSDFWLKEMHRTSSSEALKQWMKEF
jgi:hypothetical protein